MSEITQLMDAVEKADSASKLVQAVQNLAKVQDKEAIPTLITVLGYNNPGAAVAAVNGLIMLGEVAIPQLLEKIDGYNYGARAWAIRACASIGDPRSLSVLEETARGDFALSVRRAAAKGLGSVKWSDIPENERLEIQSRVLETLLQVGQDFEWVVRYAAIVALEALREAQPLFKEKIADYLTKILKEDEDLTVRARSQKALGEVFIK